MLLQFTDDSQININALISEFHDIKIPDFKNFMEIGWKHWEDSKGFKLVFKDEPNGVRSIKSEITINKDTKIIFDYLKNIENKKNYDSSFECGYVFTELNENFLINYVKHKGVLFISPRDFVNLVFSKYEEDQSLILFTSVIHDELPEIKGNVRGEIKYAGFQITKVAKGQSRLTFFSCVDVKLNQTLVNAALKNVSYAVKKIKKILEK
jgi:hypothetical protein